MKAGGGNVAEAKWHTTLDTRGRKEVEPGGEGKVTLVKCQANLEAAEK